MSPRTGQSMSKKSSFVFQLRCGGGGGGVVAFSSLARILGECSTIHSLPSLAHTNSTLCARISPQWLSELRRLWLNAR